MPGTPSLQWASSATCQPAGLRPAPLRGHRPALVPSRALEHSGPPPGADALPALLPRARKPDPGQRGSRDLQREARTVVVAGRTNGREREPWVPWPRHLPGAPCARCLRVRPARPVPGRTYSQLLAAAENTAKTRSRSDRRHERGLMVSRAPGPGQRPRGSRRGGRWAPRGTGWGAGPGRAAGLSLRAAGRAARCCARCPADPTVSAAPEPGCGGSGGGGRAAGGAGRGRAEDGVTWAGPAARDTPPPPHGGGPEPAGLGFSWGASPARRPGALGAPARCRHAWPHAAQLGRARGAATQLLGPRPGPLGRAGTAPPARRCGHCSAALAAPRGPPPAPGSRDPRSTPAGRRSHPSAAATRAHTGASAPGAPGCGAARLSPPDPSRPSGPRVLRSGPSLALTSLQPSRSWTGASLLRAAWDSGLRLRESETSLLDRPGFWRAQGSKVLSESLAFLSRPNT